MGDGEVTSPKTSFTELFIELFPVYLSFGMTYELFWYGDVEMATAYRKAFNIQRQRRNEEMWLNGMYMVEALSATVGNMFSKGRKHRYPSEPFPITQAELEERKEREQKAKMDRIKAAFTAKALGVNAKMGVSK